MKKELRYTAEASDLQLPPGKFPGTVRYGEQNFYLLKWNRNDSGDIEFADYQADSGDTLRVFND